MEYMSNEVTTSARAEVIAAAPRPIQQAFERLFRAIDVMDKQVDIVHAQVEPILGPDRVGDVGQYGHGDDPVSGVALQINEAAARILRLNDRMDNIIQRIEL